ncbi:hypothetical protein RclHR1_01340018 [Rhizophagus clarus]|uniref:Uncharacterized protein n=1 Tax=Rhizophagus clarus TaxID=94130 RepID=A0A2Z6QQC1_9GLOM|nr:hypothetical protein RclHR1_01340018 [Rhizophagus clarus]GES72826.1 hypothetical protein GLOIN_2v1874000 [Rhizophagus clarus]
MFTDSDIPVHIKTIRDPPLQSNKVYYLLNVNDKLSDVRKKLKRSKIINDSLDFSRKQGNEFYKTSRDIEERVPLEHIIDKVVNDDNSTDIFLYLTLKKNEENEENEENPKPNWVILNEKCKLDYGCIMSYDGIKRANKQAFIMKDCELTTDIGAKGYKKDQLEFNSKVDWMKKTNLFVNIDDINVDNFANYGLSVGISYLKDENFIEEITSVYKYIELKKALLNFHKYLEPTEEFIKAVNDVILSENPREEFKEIIQEYGQFIPTKVIFGGRVYFEDVKKSSENTMDKSNEASINVRTGGKHNESKKFSKFYSFNRTKFLGGKCFYDKDFDENAEKDWKESLNDRQNWECIEFQNSFSIFRFLSDELCKKLFTAIGKKIIYTSNEDCDYYLHEPGVYRHLELDKIPPHISRILQKKDADCDIFATVINTEDSQNVFFNCQIFNSSESKGKPSIIIHGIQKKFHRCKYKLKVGWMVIGYDTEFSFIHSDASVQLIKNEYNSQDQHEFDSIKLQTEYDLMTLMTKNIPFFGIPRLNDLNSSNNTLVIGHNFYNAQLDARSNFRVDTFSYCSKTNCYAKLPKFIFCTLIILNNSTSITYELLPFEFNKLNMIFGNKPYIDLKGKFTSKSTDSLNPKCVSLILSKDNNYIPIYLNQNKDQINIEYVKCRCNKTCFICKDEISKVSAGEDNAICMVCSLSETTLASSSVSDSLI